MSTKTTVDCALVASHAHPHPDTDFWGVVHCFMFKMRRLSTEIAVMNCFIPAHHMVAGLTIWEGMCAWTAALGGVGGCADVHIICTSAALLGM